MADEASRESGEATDRPRRGWPPLGLISGALVFAALLLAPPPPDMPPAAWRVVAVAALMTTWWVSEALPVAATALLPVLLFPLLGVSTVDAATAPYADPVIFLFLGGMALGAAVQRWGLHRRVALRIVALVGLKPASLVLGFMAATAFLSMWVSNTATATMMLPVTLSVVSLLVGAPERIAAAAKGQANFAVALLLGVAFAASIGGLATLVGTPPNALFAGFMRRAYGLEIGFAQWMAVGLPVSLAMLIGCWLILTRLAFPVPAEGPAGLGQRLAEARAQLGPVTQPELRAALVFALAALAWVARPLFAGAVPGLDDAVIAVAAMLALFLAPSGRGGPLLDWESALRLPWGVLLLFGGGLSLAAAISGSGLADWLGAQLGRLGALPVTALLLKLIATTILLSELASNTASAAALLPLAGSIAAGLGAAPVMLTAAVTLAASSGFMLPIATPPNALFYGSGYLTTRQMVRAGAWIDLLGGLLALAAAYSLVGFVFRAA